MRKTLFSVLILAALLLSACLPTTATPGSPTAAVEDAPATQSAPVVATRDPNAVEMACEVVSVEPTPGPTEVSMFPPVGEDDWVLGDNPNAALTVVEYSDFQCPYCSQLAPILKELQARNPDDVRVVFRHFPLPSHTLATLAAQATEAAGQQGKFWEMHDLIFAEQGIWFPMTEDQFAEWLVDQAGAMELDTAAFQQAMESEAVVNKVREAQDHAMRIGLPGTPFVLVNGDMYPDSLPRDIANFEAIMQLYKLKERQFTYCPPMEIDPQKQYIATLNTEQGDIVIQLYPDKAPMAVNSFVFLARQGYLDGVTFHRVLPSFVAQAGDPSGTGFGTPGYAFADEISDLKFDKAGVVAMANSGPDTNGSQFFITYAPLPDLDGGYTIFGQVIEGMDVAEKLSPRDPNQTLGLPPGDQIESVEIKEQ